MDSVTDNRLTRPLGSAMSLPDFSQKHLSICKKKGDRRKLARGWVHPCPPPPPPRDSHLIDGQVGTGIRDDAKHVGQVATIKGSGALLLQSLPGTVQQPFVLTRPAQG